MRNANCEFGVRLVELVKQVPDPEFAIRNPQFAIRL